MLPQQSNFCTHLVGMAALNDRQLIVRLCGLRKIKGCGRFPNSLFQYPISAGLFFGVSVMPVWVVSIFRYPKDMKVDPYPNTAHYKISLVPLDAVVWPEGQVL